MMPLPWRRPNAGRRPVFRRPGPDGPLESWSDDSQSSARQTRAGVNPARVFIMLGFLKKLIGGGGRFDSTELTRRLGVGENELRATPMAYRTFSVPKRTGGTRTITAPNDDLKQMQR